MMDVSAKTQEPGIERKRKRSPASELKMVDFRRKVPEYESMVDSRNARFRCEHQSCRA